MRKHSLLRSLERRIKERSASGVIINEKNEILLLMRDDYPVWVNIGGYLDNGENFDDALYREAIEEANLKIEIIERCGEYFTLIPQKGSVEKFCHEKLYLCKPTSKNALATLGNEGVRVQWFERRSLPYNIPPQYKLRIKETLSGSYASQGAILKGFSMEEFSQSLKKEDIYGLEDWLSHPRVAKKESWKNLPTLKT